MFGEVMQIIAGPKNNAVPYEGNRTTMRTILRIWMLDLPYSEEIRHVENPQPRVLNLVAYEVKEMGPSPGGTGSRTIQTCERLLLENPGRVARFFRESSLEGHR